MPPARRASAKAVRTWPDKVPGPTRTLGWAVLGWTAEYLRQPDGPRAGEPWEFTPEQARIVLRWYEIDAKGRFVHRRGVLRRMKGWGKDPFLGALAAVELCGPCRFGGWGSNRRPLAIQHSAPWVQVAAVNQDQTRNTMTLFPGLFSPEAIEEYRVDLGKQIIYARGNGRIEAVTSSPRALEGGRPSLVIANETHHWLASNDGVGMAQAIQRNLAKSRDGAARVMEITNAHLPDEGSAAEATYEAWRKDGSLAGVYYDSLEAPALQDLSDTPALRRALLAARGDSDWVDVERLIEEIQDPVTPEHISRRFYLNQVTEAKPASWLPDGAWDACAEPGAIPAGETVTLGFDGSFNHDSTALVVCSVGESPHLDVVACWERPADARTRDEWLVPVLDVEDAIRDACRRWQVVELVCDPARWARTYQVLADEGLPVVEYPQSASRMVPATQRFYEAVLNKTLTHSGDVRLARHIGNCVIRTDSRGSRLSKPSQKSLRKIDLAVAAVMALDRAAQAETQAPALLW